jgi:hypothetical protein
VEISDEALAAIVAALGGAIVGSLITAWLSNYQLTRQLDHSRELADLAELREVLDEAGTLGAEVSRRTRRVYVLLTEQEGDSPDLDELDEESARIEIAYLRSLMQRQREAHDEFFAGSPEVMMMLQRIMLRLDPGDPITEAFEAFFDSVGGFLNALPDDTLDVDEETANELDTHRVAVDQAQLRFLHEARARVGVTSLDA